MVDQSQEHENVSDTISYDGAAGFLRNTIYNYLTEYKANEKEIQHKISLCNYFAIDRCRSDDLTNFYRKLEELHIMVKNQQFATSMDSITKFKLLRLTHLWADDELKIEKGVIQHIESKLKNGHSYYVMYEPLTSFDDFEGSVENFCRSNPNSSGTYITPILRNKKFYLGFVNIKNGQFDKGEMKIYAPQNRIFQGNEQACIEVIDSIINDPTYIKSPDDFRNFSDFQKENTQRDFSDDDGPVVELVTTSSDEPQDMLHTQHNEFEFDNSPFSMPLPPLPNFDNMSQNMPPHNGDQRNTSRYAYDTSHIKRDSSNDRPVLYYVYGTGDKESCCRTLQKNHIGEIAGISDDGQSLVLHGLVTDSLSTHGRVSESERTFFYNIWKEGYNKLKKVTYDQAIEQLANHYSSTVEKGKEGYWLNSSDIDLLKLYYANKLGYQVLYHYNPVNEDLGLDGKLQQYQTIVTEIKTDQNVSYFMMPCMTVRNFQAQDDSFAGMENMVKSLQADTVQDGVYLIPTCQSSSHWELTCAKKQGDSLEYFVTKILSNGANCGLNTVQAMQYVIENGYEEAKDKKYAHRLYRAVDFAKKKDAIKDKEQTNDISDGEEDNIGNEHILTEENNHGIYIEKIPNDIHRNRVGDRNNSNSEYHNTQYSYVPQHNFPNNNGFDNPPNVFTPQNVPLVYQNVEKAMKKLQQQGVIAGYKMQLDGYQTFTCHCRDQKNHIFGLECGYYTNLLPTKYKFVGRGRNIPVNNDGYYYSLYDDDDEQGAYATSLYQMRRKEDVQHFVEDFSKYMEKYRSPEEKGRREEERRQEEYARLYNNMTLMGIFHEYNFSENKSGNAIFAANYFNAEYRNKCYINYSGTFGDDRSLYDNMVNGIVNNVYKPQIYYQYSRNTSFIHDINLNADVNQELQDINLFLGKANICERIKEIKALAAGANLEIKYKADGQKDFKTFNTDKDYQDFFEDKTSKYTFKVGQKEYEFDLSTFKGQRNFFENIDKDIGNLKNFNKLNLEENNDRINKRVYLKGHNKTYLADSRTKHYITDFKQLPIDSVFNGKDYYFFNTETRRGTQSIKLLNYINDEEGLKRIVSNIEKNEREQPKRQPERPVRRQEEEKKNTRLLAQAINKDPILRKLTGTCINGVLTIHSDNPSYEIQLRNESKRDYTVENRQITLGEFIRNSSDTDQIKLVIGYQKPNEQLCYLPTRSFLDLTNTETTIKNIKILMLTSFLSNTYVQHQKSIKITNSSDGNEYTFLPVNNDDFSQSVRGLANFLSENYNKDIQIDIDGQNFSYNLSTKGIKDAQKGVNKILLAGAIKENFQNHGIEIRLDENDGSAYFEFNHDKFKFYDDRENAILYDNLCKDGQVSYTKIAELKHAYIKGDNDLEEKFYIQDFSDERQVEYFDDFLNKKEQQCTILYQKLQRNCQSILLNDRTEGTLVYKTNGNDEYQNLEQNDLYTLKDAEIYYHVTNGTDYDNYIPAALVDSHMTTNGRRDSLKYNNNHMQEYADSLQRRHLILDQMPRPENIEERKRDNIDYLTNYIFRNMLLSNDCKTLVNTKNEFAGQHEIQLFDNDGHEITFNNVELYNEESIKDKLQRTKTIKFSYKNGKHTSYDGFNEFDMERDDYTTFQARMKTMEQADALYIIADDTKNNLGERLFDSNRSIGRHRVFSEDEYKDRGTRQNAENGLQNYRRIAVEKILGEVGLRCDVAGDNNYLYLSEGRYGKLYYVKLNEGYVQGNEGLLYDGINKIGLWLQGEEDYLTQRVSGPIEGAQLCCNLIKRHMFANEVEQRRFLERKKRFKVDEHTYENGDYQGFRKALIDHSVEAETTEERKKVTLIRPNGITVNLSPRFNIFNNSINEVLAVIDGRIGSAVNPKLVDTFNELGYHFQFENATKTACADCNGTQIYVGKKSSRGIINNLTSIQEVNNIKDFLELCDKDPQDNEEILLYCDINGQRICSKGIQYKDYKEVEDSTKEELKGFHERIAIIKKLQEINDTSDITISFTKPRRPAGPERKLADCLGDLQKFSDDIASCSRMTIKCGENTVIYNPTKECRDHYDFDNLDNFINRMNKNVNNDAKDGLQSDLQWDVGENTYKCKGQRCEVYYYQNDVSLANVEDGKTVGDIIKKTRKYEQEEPLIIKYKDVHCPYYLYRRDAKEQNERIYSMVDFCDDFIKLNRDEGIRYEIKNTYDNSDIGFSNNAAIMLRDLENKTCKITMTKDGDSAEIEVQFDTKDHIVEAINQLKDTAEGLLNPIGLDMLNTFDSSKKKKHKKHKKTKDDSVDIEDTTVIKDEEIEESKKEKKKKEEKYDPFEDIENNPELRKLVESFIEQSNPDMSAVIRQDGMMKLIQSDSIIEDFRKSAKYDKDYLTNSSNAMDTMEDIQKLDDILHKEGDFYDKCDYYQTLGIKLANKNVHELQLLAVAEYVNRNENQEAKYFTSDKLNGPNYVYLEDKKLLISLSPEGYKDDFVGENKELEELIKNNSVTKLSAKKKDGDWVLDCYLNKDKDHLIVDPRVDGRQVDATSSGVWAARSTSEIIELGVENFKFLNAYRQTVQEYPDFLRNEEPSDLNRIKLSFRKFNHLEKEEQTAETFAKILDEVENKSPVEVITELKYTVMDKKNTGKSKQDKEKEEKEEAERKAMHNLEIDKKIEQITNKEKRNKFFGFSFSGSAMLAMGIGGPLGIVTGLTVCAALIFTRQMILRRKNKMKATQDVKEKDVENKPLLEAQPSLGNEVYNDSEKSKKDITKLLPEDLSKVFTKDLDLKANNILVDNVKVKKTEQVRESS